MVEVTVHKPQAPISVPFSDVGDHRAGQMTALQAGDDLVPRLLMLR